MGRSTSPNTDLLEPSKARTTNSLGLNSTPALSIRMRADLGSTFKEDPVSTKTQDKVVPLHSIEICKALLWFLPSGGRSQSVNPKPFPAEILLVTASS